MKINVNHIYYLTDYTNDIKCPSSSVESSVINNINHELLDTRLVKGKIYNKLSKIQIAEISTHLIVYNDIMYNKHLTSLIINLPQTNTNIDSLIENCISEENFKNSNIFYISDSSMYFIDLKSVQKILNLPKITHDLKTTFEQQKLTINRTIQNLNIKSYIPNNFMWDTVFGV